MSLGGIPILGADGVGAVGAVCSMASFVLTEGDGCGIGEVTVSAMGDGEDFAMDDALMLPVLEERTEWAELGVPVIFFRGMTGSGAISAMDISGIGSLFLAMSSRMASRSWATMM